MRLHTSISKRIVMFALALCLCSTLLFPSGLVLADINHTHVCYDGNHVKPEDCVDSRECCKKCISFHNVKNLILRLHPLPRSIFFEPTKSSALHSNNVFVYTEISTLTSLKIRLDN